MFYTQRKIKTDKQTSLKSLIRKGFICAVNNNVYKVYNNHI